MCKYIIPYIMNTGNDFYLFRFLKDKGRYQQEKYRRMNMNKTVKNYIEKLVTDPALAEKAQNCKTQEEAYDIAKPYLDECTLSDFVESMKEMNQLIETAKKSELTDDDMKNATLDQNNTTITTVTTTTTAPIAANAAAAAAI